MVGGGLWWYKLLSFQQPCQYCFLFFSKALIKLKYVYYVHANKNTFILYFFTHYSDDQNVSYKSDNHDNSKHHRDQQTCQQI